MLLGLKAQSSKGSIWRKVQESPNPDPAASHERKTWQQPVAESLARTKAANFPPDSAYVTPPEAPPLTHLTADLIRELEWKRLELLVSLYFNATGLRAECTRIGADGGIDVVLYQPGEERPSSYVQCKAWGSEFVGVTLMRELFGVMAADKVAQGVFVTTSDFTPDARAFGTTNKITLITTRDLVDRFGKLPTDVRGRILGEVTAGDYTTPTCPACDRKMIWKEKPRFWACPKYPACRSKPIYPRAVKI